MKCCCSHSICPTFCYYFFYPLQNFPRIMVYESTAVSKWYGKYFKTDICLLQYDLPDTLAENYNNGGYLG